MQQTEQLIAIFHTGFIICLVLTIFFAGLSIFIFFKFRIRNIFNFLTGREQKRTIRMMEEENAQTGKLRQDTYVSDSTGDLYKTPSGQIPPVIFPATQQTAVGGEPTEKMAVHTQDNSTGSVSQLHTGQEERTEPFPEGSESTTLLDSGIEATTLLNSNPDINYGLESSQKETIANEGSGQTASLYGKMGETVLLTPEMEKVIREEQEKKRPYTGRFEIIKEMMLIHTEEII